MPVMHVPFLVLLLFIFHKLDNMKQASRRPAKNSNLTWAELSVGDREA